MPHRIEWRESAKFALDHFRKGIPRIDEAIRGMVWGLERDPYICPVVPGTHVRFIYLGPLKHEQDFTCLIRVAYSITDNHVVAILLMDLESVSS